MTQIEIAKATLAAIDKGDFETVAGYLTDDCIVIGPAPEPLPKEAFIAMQSAVVRAIPNWRFNPSNIHEHDNTVHVTLDVTGTHTAELALPIPGFPPVAATGKAIKQPQESIEFTFQGNKISKIDLEQVPNGGLLGVFQQLGVELPGPHSA